MSPVLQDKVAIITGASRGIGKAFALRFAEEGASVVVVDCSDEDGLATVDFLKSRGTNAIFCQADVSKETECIGFARAAVETFGRIDVLVANAGIRVFGTILDATEAIEEGLVSGARLDAIEAGLATVCGLDADEEVEADRLWDCSPDEHEGLAAFLAANGYDGIKWAEQDMRAAYLLLH